MENGKWKVESGELRIKNGECERSEPGIYFKKVCAGENGE
jgi:hypothetical protein